MPLSLAIYVTRKFMPELVALYGMSCGSTVINLIGEIAIYFDINHFSARARAETTLESFRKGIVAGQATQAVKLLKENGIFSHAMFVIGSRKDTRESIADLTEFANMLDPDFAIFTALTPFPGTEIYEEAKRKGWIEDFNLSHYDMAHAIMPTETLSRMEVQEELYNCYRSFYGSMRRKLGGVFSSNKLKSRLYRHMMGQGVIRQFKNLIPLTT